MWGAQAGKQRRSETIGAGTTTRRLRLRALTATEILTARQTRRLPDEGGPWPADDLGVLGHRADQVKRLRDQAEATFLLWLATTPQGEYVGRIGCHEPPSVDRVVEIGYYIRDVHRGKGLAHEMVNAFLSWLRAHNVVSVRATVRPSNDASIAILHSAGFRPTGRSLVDPADGPEDEYCLTITSAVGDRRPWRDVAVRTGSSPGRRGAVGRYRCDVSSPPRQAGGLDMTLAGFTADVPVNDLEVSRAFYAAALGRQPDLTPAPEMAEWILHQAPQIALRIVHASQPPGDARIGIGVTDLVTELALSGAHGSARTSSRSGAGPIESEG